MAKYEKATVSPVMWRSNRIRRVVASTLVGEAVAFSGCLSGMGYFQVMLRDLMHGDVTSKGWTQYLLPFAHAAVDTSESSQFAQALSVIDAGPVCDATLRVAAVSDRTAELPLVWPWLAGRP